MKLNIPPVKNTPTNKQMRLEILRYEKLKKCIYLTGNFIVLDVVYPYEIGLESIKDQRELLGWTRHLTEKNWVTGEVISMFIDTVNSAKGWTRCNSI